MKLILEILILKEDTKIILTYDNYLLDIIYVL